MYFKAFWNGERELLGIADATGKILCPNILTTVYEPVNAILIIEGKDKKVNVNPDPTTEIVAGDMIILFEEDDGAYKDDYQIYSLKESIVRTEK